MSAVFACEAEDIWNTDASVELIERYRHIISSEELSSFSIDIALGVAVLFAFGSLRKPRRQWQRDRH